MAETAQQEVSEALKAFVYENFSLAGEEGVDETELLLEEGIVDSLGLLEIVDFIETSYGITINDTDMVLDNFGTIETIAAFIICSMESP